MLTALPGQTTTVTASGLPSGDDVGYQVVKAATGAVAIARTDVGVVERPSGSGNYVVVLVAPAEGDLYLVVLDWSGGVLAPETSRVIDLNVSSVPAPGSSGLGLVADYAKMHLGGETWRGLIDSDDYGPSFIEIAIGAVERRVLINPPTSPSDEAALDPRVIDYLGLLAALQLVPAARDYWGSTAISVATGVDGSESVTYANRATLINQLRDDLMAALPAAQIAALPFLDTPNLVQATLPAIDEEHDRKVTADPRRFPTERRFPFGGRDRAVDSTPLVVFPWWEERV